MKQDYGTAVKTGRNGDALRTKVTFIQPCFEGKSGVSSREGPGFGSSKVCSADLHRVGLVGEGKLVCVENLDIERPVYVFRRTPGGNVNARLARFRPLVGGSEVEQVNASLPQRVRHGARPSFV